MYILSISKKAFVRFEENGDTTIVLTSEKATQFKTIGNAMRAAIKVNEDFEAHVAKVMSL